MPKFQITSPDGTRYEVEGPEGATEKDALAQLQASLGATPSTPKTVPNQSDGGSALKGAGMLADTLGEGAFRALVEGPGQLVSAVAQAPFSIADAARVGAPFTVEKPSATILKDYNDSVKSGRAERADVYRNRYGQEPDEAGIALGEIAGGLAMGGPKGEGLPAATTKIRNAMLRSVKSGAKAGAVGAASSYNPGDNVSDKLMWTAGGGLLGAGIGLVPAVGAGLQTAFRKYLTTNTVGDAAQTAKELTGFIPGLEGKLNAGQETGNAGVQKFLAKSAGRYAQEQLLSQTEALEKHLGVLDRLYGEIRPAEEVVKRGQQALINQRDHMVAARKRMWDADLDAMRTKVTADVYQDTGMKSTSQVAVELPGLREGFAEITRDFVNSGGNALSPGFQKILNEYKTFDGHLSFDSLEHLLRLTSGNSGSILSGGANAEAQKAAGKQLRRVVFNAIDSMPDQTEIGSMLKQMRAGYAARSKAITDFNNTAAAKILNVKTGDLVSDPESAVAKLLELDGDQLAKLTPVLKGAAPEVLSSLRSANIRNAYQEARIPNAKPGTPSWDLDAFLKATVRNGRLRAAGLYSEGEQEILTRNMTALRPLLIKTAQNANVPEVEQTAMVLPTMAPAFVARALFRLTGQKNVDKLLFDPTAYQKFKQIDTLMQSKKWDQAAYQISHLTPEVTSDDE